MKETYTIPQDSREKIEKLVARFQKKAAKYDKALTAEYGEPYAVRRPMYAADHETHTLAQVGETMVEVFDLTIESEIIQKDGYTVVAKIEHMENGNFVTAFNGEAKEAWRSASCNCEHCNVKRNRALTFIVRNADGDEKQIGRACLKEYCGIDPQMIGKLNELRDLVLDEDIRAYDFNERPVSRIHDFKEVLAAAIHVYKMQGYVKTEMPNSNRGKLSECMRQREITDADMDEAEHMTAELKEMDADLAFRSMLDNVRTLALNGYCKDSHFGYIAFAPAAYERYLEKAKKDMALKQARQAERDASEYVGQVGKRIDIEIASMKLLTTIESAWGYTYLYKFIDINGNVLIWFASNRMERVNENGEYVDVDSVSSIRATVKGHSERDGVKQTVITRCKAA